MERCLLHRRRQPRRISVGLRLRRAPARLTPVSQPHNPGNGATYTYDLRGRLSSRTVTQTTAPTSTTTLYIYDLSDHLIAEVNPSGQTMREHIWLDDLPVAVVDGVQTGSPTIYYVHVDHLKRPIRITNQSWGWVWDVKYAPFGATTYVWSNPAVMNARFPGQWFQIESGLAYNWHRHYDPTLGRYLQPDPLLSDETGLTVNGLPADTLSASYGSDGRAIAKSMGWKEAHDAIMDWAPARPMMQDGPSVFGYAGQNSLHFIDPTGESAGLLACPFGGITNPVCEIVIGQTVVTLSVIAIGGICEMARETGVKNYVYFEAKLHPDPCKWLEDE